MDVNMNLKEILMNAFIFPSKNLETLSIYAIFLVLTTAFLIEGILSVIFGIFGIGNLLVGIVYIIIAIILILLTRSISIQCIKSGIELEEKLPDFKWWKSLGSGFGKIVITIFYFLVPALIVVLIALLSNIIGTIINLGQEIALQIPNILIGNSALASGAISMASLPLLISLAITISAGMIIFLIFSFFQCMAEAKLANNGSLIGALNFVGAARDLTRIGVIKVIMLSILIFVIVSTIEIITALIFNHLLVLSILTIIVTPYITLFGQRALGLLYSDIV